MPAERYIWCRNCNEIHHVNSFDKAPVYVLSGLQVNEVSADDWRAFMDRHSGHRLEGLESLGGRFSSGQVADPMREQYTEVTNGQEWFVVRSFRKSVEEPLRFELIPGRLAPAGSTVEIQPNEIRKEMKYHFLWGPAEKPSDEKIESFLACFKDLVERLDLSDIRFFGNDYTDSSADCGLLETRHVKALLERCKQFLDPAELEGLQRFVEAQNGADGVLRFRVRHRYEIEQRVK
jgi:hypothetical protein